MIRPIGVGVDLVEIRRVQRMLDRFGVRGLRHLLTPNEQSYCLSRPKSAQHIAGRVASKEAAYKALQGVEHAKRVSWLDVEVCSSTDGRPSLKFTGRAKEAADKLGVGSALVSISHSRDTAIALVVLTGSADGVPQKTMINEKRWQTVRASSLLRTVLVAAVGVTCAKQPEIRLEDFRGAMVTPSVPKIDFTLTDQHGQPFSFSKETDGVATLLFFGYTYCPDICPVHMAQIAVALDQLGDEVAEQIKVVFVSVDPERDTPERLAQWLGAFHPRFIGLTGPIEQINRIQLEMRFRPGTMEELDGDNYGVAHSSAVVGFTRDNQGRFFYLSGTRTEDYVNDIPLLIGFTGED